MMQEQVILVNKKEAFDRAFKYINNNPKVGEVYISQTPNEDGTYKVGSKVPEGTKSYTTKAGYTRYEGYWFVGETSAQLVELLGLELKYAEAMNKHIVAAMKNKSSTESSNKKDKAFFEVLKKARIAANKSIADLVKSTEVDPSILNTDTGKPKSKPKAKPKKTENTTIDYSNPDLFILPEFMWKLEKWMQSISAGVLVIQIDKDRTGIQQMRVKISDSKPYFLKRTGKKGTEQDFKSKAEFDKWLALQKKIEADQNKARKIGKGFYSKKHKVYVDGEDGVLSQPPVKPENYEKL